MTVCLLAEQRLGHWLRIIQLDQARPWQREVQNLGEGVLCLGGWIQAPGRQKIQLRQDLQVRLWKGERKHFSLQLSSIFNFWTSKSPCAYYTQEWLGNEWCKGKAKFCLGGPNCFCCDLRNKAFSTMPSMGCDVFGLTSVLNQKSDVTYDLSVSLQPGWLFFFKGQYYKVKIYELNWLMLLKLECQYAQNALKKKKNSTAVYWNEFLGVAGFQRHSLTSCDFYRYCNAVVSLQKAALDSLFFPSSPLLLGWTEVPPEGENYWAVVSQMEMRMLSANFWPCFELAFIRSSDRTYI